MHWQCVKSRFSDYLRSALTWNTRAISLRKNKDNLGIAKNFHTGSPVKSRDRTLESSSKHAKSLTILPVPRG